MKNTGTWVTLFAAACLTGCKSSPAIHVSAVPAVPASVPTVSSRDGSTSVGIASGWRAGVDKLTDNLTDLAGSVGGSSATSTTDAMGQDPNSTLGQMARDVDRQSKEDEEKAIAALEKKGIVINVINGSKQIPGEARTHYYVRKTHRDHNVTWDEALAIEQEHLALRPKPTEVQLPIGKALKFDTRDEMRDGGVVFQTSYVVIEGQDTYALHFITEESKETIASIADSVAQTWRVKAK